MKQKTYIGRVLISLDQLGNALAGGNPDATISGRLGYLYEKRPTFWTTFLMLMVDAIFYPLDSEGHCRQAYEKEPFKRKFRRGSDVGLALLGILTIFFCILLAIPIWMYVLILKITYLE